MNRIAYNSRLYGVPAEIKAVCCLMSLVCVITADELVFSAVMLAVMFAAGTVLSGLSPRKFLKLLLIPAVFLLAGAAVIAAGVSDAPRGMAWIRLRSIYLYTDKDLLMSALCMVMRSLSAVSCLYFLYVSTPVEHMISLMNRIRLPKILTEMMLLILRFIFILLELSRSMTDSQNSRLGSISFSSRLRSSSMLISSLFVKAFIKSEDIFKAMESRGYDGSVDFIRERTRPSKKQVLIAGTYCILAAVSVIIIRSRA